MWNFIQAGGTTFTIPLVLLFGAIVTLIALRAVRPEQPSDRRLGLILHLGVFSAVWGILGQVMGLYQAMNAIEMMGGVSPAMLAGGLKVSSIATLFGLANLAVALAGWTVLRYVSRT